jgi:Molybdopterin-binding domain of aldehyde dehydrogenase
MAVAGKISDGLSRRVLLTGGLAGGFLLAFRLPLRAVNEPVQPPDDTSGKFAPNAFIRIDEAGHSTLVMPQVEMGQGVYTAIAMILAEELDADFAHVTLEHAPPNDKLYGNPTFGIQVTGNSNSKDAPTHRAAIVYYEQQSLGRRLNQVDELLKSAFQHPDNKALLEEWQRLKGRMNELLPMRNIIAHQPVRRLGASDGKKAVYRYGIYLEPYQRFLKKNAKGWGGKDAIETDDLIKHSVEVVTLEDDLKAFVRKIVQADRSR